MVLRKDAVSRRAGTIALAVVLAFVWQPLFWLLMILAGWMAIFFRDPVRIVPDAPGLVVSPANDTKEARAAWAAFRSPDPTALQSVKTTSLPFLAAALRRHLEEFPWTTDGLSRLERAILNALPRDFAALFATVEEDPKFLGDVVLRWHLERLRKEGVALGKPRPHRLPRWLGGYEVRDESLRWDPALGRLVAG